MAKKLASAEVRKILKERFGHQRLREGQQEIIESVLGGQHTLALMPTGAGKSLCFQLPALMLEGTTIVVTPLIALIKDQKEKLDRLEISNIELNSTLTAREQSDNVELAAQGQTEFVYVTPERLTSPEFLKSIEHLTIDLMVIDEAHCVSQWGHDFRPAYLALNDAWKKLGEPCVLALTATATDDVVEDIKAQLNLPSLKVFSSGILRSNLRYRAILFDKEEGKKESLPEILRLQQGSGIIYCATVRSAKELHEELEAQGFAVDIYHGKLSVKERSENRHRFMDSHDRIMIATNAFGMGIDKPDIRFVIHYQFPGSLESYYQESGRAGRDGQDANCILFYLKKDKNTQRFFLVGKYPSEADYKSLYALLRVHAGTGEFIPEAKISEATKTGKSKIKVMLTSLAKHDVVKVGVDGVRVLRADVSLTEIEDIARGYLLKKEADAEKLKQMVMYAQSSMCRWKLLLKYFDQDVEWKQCGHCDNCISRPEDGARLDAQVAI